MVNGPLRRASMPVMLRLVKVRVVSIGSVCRDPSRASRSWISGRWWLESSVSVLDRVEFCHFHRWFGGVSFRGSSRYADEDGGSGRRVIVICCSLGACRR